MVGDPEVAATMVKVGPAETEVARQGVAETDTWKGQQAGCVQSLSGAAEPADRGGGGVRVLPCGGREIYERA